MSNKLSEKMTENEKEIFDAGKKEAAKKYQERKVAAKLVISEYFKTDESNDIPSEVKTAIEYITGSGNRMANAGVTNLLKEFLLEGDKTSMEIYQKFEYGRPTMNSKIRDFIKNGKPEDRIWVEYDEKTKTYSVVAEGADTPENWKGYVPVEKKEL